MTNYTDAELEAMLRDLESDLVERKESFKSVADKVREAVCAFSKDLPDHRKAGVVFIGAMDDGKPSNLPIDDELLLQIANIKSDGNILPPPSLTVAKRHLNGSDLAVITVEPADSPPVRSRGRIYIRTGPRRDIATAQDERILNEKRRFRDKPFDIRPVPSASIDDLDRLYFEQVYLPGAVAPDVLEANERSFEQRLAAAKMIVSVDDTTPTVLGILVLCSRTRDFLPGAYFQFLRIDGTELSDPVIDEALVDGRLPDVVRGIEEKLKLHNQTSIEFISGPTELRSRPYPLAALFQLTRNAILHRTYETTNAPGRVYWYDDRIEIMSPGGPFGQVTPETFGRPGVTDYRNPNLAEAMRALGYVQRFGAGLGIARAELAKNGNPPPEFDVTHGHVLAKVLPAI